MKLSIVIPVYNEKETIQAILEKVKALDYDKEIILVDDFSTDGTRDILKGLEGEEGIVATFRFHKIIGPVQFTARPIWKPCTT